MRIIALVIMIISILLVFSFLKHQKNTALLKKDGGLVQSISTLIDWGGGRMEWSDNNTIAFSKFTGEVKYYAEIYTINPDGSNEKCVTCNNSQISHLSNDQPTWEASGRYVVFQSVDQALYDQAKNIPEKIKQAVSQGGAGVDNNLWAITADGVNAYQLTQVKRNEINLHPHFAFDGKKLVWSGRESTGLGEFKYFLKTADFVDNNGVRLENIQEYQPLGDQYFYESHGFSKNGEWIIFSASPPGPFDLDIYKMNLQTRELINLTDSPGVWDEHAQVSPGGQKIIWISSQGYDYKLTKNYGKTLKTDFWMMDFDGSNKKQITFFNIPGHNEYNGSRVIVADSSWSPIGDKLVATYLGIKGNINENKILIINLKESL